jgi:MurNAc alpha-1-phosphate uridylyltransferase
MFQVAILAGGLATRLRPLTNDTPKALVEVNERPFVDWQLSLLSRNGISNILFCVSHKSDLIENYVGDGSGYGLTVKYSRDGENRLGTGGAIRKALDSLEDNFMVLYGDSYLDIDYKKAQEAFVNCGKPAMMTVFKNDGAYDASNIKFTQFGLEEYEKGTIDPKFEHIDYGLNFFTKELFTSINFDSPFELSDLLTQLSRDKKLAGYEVYNRFYEVGSFKGIEDLKKYLKGS